MRILIVYDNWGGGHKRTAHIIQNRYPDHEVILKTGDELVGNGSIDKMVKVYVGLIRKNWIWVVDITINYLLRFIMPFLEVSYSDNFYRSLDEINPDLVISTTESVNKVIDSWCQEKNIPFHIYVTTFFPCVFDNLSPNAIHYCYFDESVEMLHAHNLNHVQHSFPIKRNATLRTKLIYLIKFFWKLHIFKSPFKKHPPLNNASSRVTGIISGKPPSRGQSDGKTILVTSGSIGGKILKKALRQIPRKYHIIVVCGNDTKTYNEIKNSGVEVYGYANNFNELILMSDVVVFRASPGILMESLLANVPVIAFGKTPLADQDCCVMIKKYGLGEVCPDNLSHCIEQVLSNKQKYKNNINNFLKKYWRPNDWI